MRTRSRIHKFSVLPACRLVGWGLTFLGIVLPAAGANLANAARAEESGVGQIANGWETNRPQNTDLLILDDRQQLSGNLLNESLSLRTAYGELHIETRKVAVIRMTGAPDGLATVFTINSNRFTGFFDDSALRFQTQEGNLLKLRREKVGGLLFARHDGELKDLSQGQWIRLRNGDLLSGRLSMDSLALTTPDGMVQVDLSDIASIFFVPDRAGTAVLSTHDGRVLHGTLALEDLPLLLDAGPQLSLYRGSVEWLSETMNGPAEIPPSVSNTNGPVANFQSPPRSELTNHPGMVWIPAGEFIMGSPADEAGRDRDEGPQTKVVIPVGFWMGICEVAQGEYQALMGNNPSINTEDPQRPVEKVSWYEAMNYCSRLTQQAQTAGRLPEGYAYRLPTEAEWEYACRAGTSTRFSCGDDKSDYQLRDYAWFTRNSESTAHPVGTRQPNPWGLHDMHGNVWEWCLDRWENALPGGTTTNTPTIGEGTLRAARGGSWLYEAKACRSANRDDYSPSNKCSDLGFRVVLAPILP